MSSIVTDESFILASCKGDSGSPVIRRVSDSARGRPYYEQHFIVSDSAVGQRCDAKASLFTRVGERQILNWIQNVKNQFEVLDLFGIFLLFFKFQFRLLKQLHY